MPYAKVSGHQLQGPQASGDCIDTTVLISLAASTTLTQGQAVSLAANSIIAPDGVPLNNLTYQNPALIVGLGETVVLPNSANAFGIMGAYQGPTFTTSASAATQFYPIQIRTWGMGLAIIGAAAAGTAQKVGSQEIFSAFPSASQTFALTAANAAVAQGLFLGIAQAAYIQTSVALAIASGSQTVTPVNNVGITTATVLTIDVPSSGVQETVTPSAIGANSNTFTATFGFAHGTNTLVGGKQATPGATIVAIPGAGTYSGAWYCMINP